jgi:predicted DCC family thiol-disulfide oxidoreductase YuxK
LATPGERPEADIVIFDGRCRFCTAQVRRLARCDTARRLAYLSLHDPEVARRWPDLSHQQLMDQMYVVDTQGHRYGGAEALRYLSRRLRLLWILMPVLHLPGTLPFWQKLYRWVAGRRYRFRGSEPCDDEGTCHLHHGG